MKEIDWEQRRYEVAREVLKMLLRYPRSKDEMAYLAVCVADALIEELKKTSK